MFNPNTDNEIIERERNAFIEGLARAYQILSNAGLADSANLLDEYVWSEEAEMEYPQRPTVTHPKSGVQYRWDREVAALERWDSHLGVWKTTRYDPDFILDLANMIKGITRWEE